MRSIEQTFNPKLNGLNALRLVLACGVLLRHSFTMLGVTVGWKPLDNLLLSGFVDGFFAISGFLIVGSWMNKPDWRRFLRARCLRILPAFWVCLVVVAFIAAPVDALITGHSMTTAFWGDAAGYVWHNAGLWIFQSGIDGTPTGAAAQESGFWNGSLWTLFWEFTCYLGVLALGLTGLLHRRAVVVGAFVLAVVVLALTDTSLLDSYLVHHAARFATMFLAGAVVYTFRRQIPASGWLLAPCAALVLFAGSLPDYRVVAALPLAYLCVVGGALVKVPALRLTNDLSYGTYIYGYPVQQLLVAVGLRSVGVGWYFVFSVLATLPVAAASWFLVERRAQRFTWPVRSKALRVELPSSTVAVATPMVRDVA